MKKFLLSCMMLLGMTGVTNAATIKIATGFGDEISSLDYITSGNKFVIGSADGKKVLYFSGNQDAKRDEVEKLPYEDSFFYYTLTKIEDLDLDEDGTPEDDIYAINIINEDGTAFPAPWGLGNNVNFTNWGAIFSGSAQADKAQGYGTDAKYQGIWKMNFSDGNGFSFKNISKELYLTVDGSQADEYFLKLYKSVLFEDKADEVVKADVEANENIFALNKATGYDAETGVMSNGGWTFDDPISILDWDYIVITTTNTAADASHEIAITDVNDLKVTGEGYAGSTAKTGGNMWLDRWNNQNAIRISIDYLRLTKGMDVTKIKSLTISGSVSISNVYLTDYNNTKINGGYAGGDVVRNYTENGKFGTICLPYKASVAGAKIYSIAGKTATGITLAPVSGLLEAGKAYFYVASDVNGQNNEGNTLNVNFFRADLEKFDVDAPVENNGLIGTFDAIEKVATGSVVLNNNKLYTVDSDVALAANKAYIDLTKISGDASRGTVTLNFDETTGIEVVKSAMSENGIFNLNGQRLAQPKKGLNIIGGKKVMMK